MSGPRKSSELLSAEQLFGQKGLALSSPTDPTNARPAPSSEPLEHIVERLAARASTAELSERRALQNELAELRALFKREPRSFSPELVQKLREAAQRLNAAPPEEQILRELKRTFGYE